MACGNRLNYCRFSLSRGFLEFLSMVNEQSDSVINKCIRKASERRKLLQKMWQATNEQSVKLSW